MIIRVGSVDYLNAAPLLYGVAADPQFELVADTPARIAAQLASGQLDIGLVPVVEAARQKLFAIGELGVAGDGPVRSVLLRSRVGRDRIRSLALDPASRTSRMLLRLLLRLDGVAEPRWLEAGPTGDTLTGEIEAALIIGDRALRVATPPGIHVTDLCQWWHEHTSLPFVFAVWAGPDPRLIARVAPRLQAAAGAGLRNLPTVAMAEAKKRAIPESVALSYLSEAIVHSLGPTHHRGLERFLELAITHELLPASASIRFQSQGVPTDG